MSTEAGIFIGTKHVLSAIGAALLASWAGWRMFFSAKIEQLDKLNATYTDMDAKLSAHIKDEDNKFKEITESIADMRRHLDGRLDKIWEFLAGQK